MQACRQEVLLTPTCFVKYQGLGNDFILVDNRAKEDLIFTPDASAKICNRNFGIGADGIIFVCRAKNGCQYTMRIHNSDGSEPQMCGNGIRCMASYIFHELNGGLDPEGTEYRIWTNAGVIIPKIMDNGFIQVEMGSPILHAARVPTLMPTAAVGVDTGDFNAIRNAVVNAPLQVYLSETDDCSACIVHVTAVSMGNPHAVIFCEDLHAMNPAFEVLGPKIEKHALFPERTNVEFVQCLSDRHLKMRVWERGSGATLACGTGACAAVVAAILLKRCSFNTQITVSLPGGDLTIIWEKSRDVLLMTGPAIAVFSGVIRLQD
jgi:diaminopimelate epimerase